MSTESLNAVNHHAAAPRLVAVLSLRPAAARNEPETAKTSDPVTEPSTQMDDRTQLGKAIEELNRYVAGSRTDLRFAVDRDAGEVVVSIIDAESGQVLRQMPSVEALRIARYLEHDRLGLIRQRA